MSPVSPDFQGDVCRLQLTALLGPLQWGFPWILWPELDEADTYRVGLWGRSGWCVGTGVSVYVSSADDTKERRGNPKGK